jgi:cell division septation protein DedD
LSARAIGSKALAALMLPVVVLALAADPALAAKKKKKGRARNSSPPPAAAPAPPPPSVKQGVTLWKAGQWDAAVSMWQPFAGQGDADAMFNLGQAYKLGRGVPLDKVQARDWYSRAALKGHLPAQANLGILLYQGGEKTEALRWLKQAADAGEMRAQYVMGIVHWNGDGAAKSLALAYGYLVRSAAQNLPEASKALNDLSLVIPAQDRANGWEIATSLAGGKGIPPRFETGSIQMAAAPVAADQLPRSVAPSLQPPFAPARRPAPPPEASVVESPANAPPMNAANNNAAPMNAQSLNNQQLNVPQPVASVPVPPPTATAPTTAPMTPPPVAVAAAPSSEFKARPMAPPPEKPPEKAKPKPEPDMTGWRIQLGAYSTKAFAEEAWAKLKKQEGKAVAKLKPVYASGRLVRLQAGPFKTREDAAKACKEIGIKGNGCFPTEG